MWIPELIELSVILVSVLFLFPFSPFFSRRKKEANFAKPAFYADVEWKFEEKFIDLCQTGK